MIDQTSETDKMTFTFVFKKCRQNNSPYGNLIIDGCTFNHCMCDLCQFTQLTT